MLTYLVSRYLKKRLFQKFFKNIFLFLTTKKFYFFFQNYYDKKKQNYKMYKVGTQNIKAGLIRISV